ncbi:MAG TPA: aldo/keto reductase, partial [Micromonosporaceae bacterium]|nr:aldo/keto reductase [Micromonosporaceae bacterium]
RAGKVRHAGLSNFAESEVDAAVHAATHSGLAAPVNLQSGYSLLERDAADGVFALCARHGIGFTAHSPLAGGWLTGKYRSGQPFPAGSRMTLRPEPYQPWNTEATYAAIDRLAGFAAERGLSLSTLALAWVVGDPAVTAVVIGPRTPEHIAQAVTAVDVTLTYAERARSRDVMAR